MAENKVKDLLGVSMDKIKQMVDVNTIVGDPIYAGKTTIIPVSKVSYGFASGGSDIPTKKDTAQEFFGGGSGAGITVTPIAFLSVSDDETKLLPVQPCNTAVDRVIDLVPTLVEKFKKFKEEKESEAKKEDEAKKEAKEKKE